MTKRRQREGRHKPKRRTGNNKKIKRKGKRDRGEAKARS
jgi:hypothetical protein